MGLSDGRTWPLAGAVVRTSDGRAVTTNGEGRFTLPGGLPSDGALVASHPGHTTSAVVGLDSAAPIVMHLSAVTGTSSVPPPSRQTRLHAVGRVVDQTGNPVPGVLVMLEDRQGAVSAPAPTDADGAFELAVFSPNRQVDDGTVLAIGTGTDGWIGLVTGVSLRPDAPDLDLDPASPGQNPLRVHPANHRVRPDINLAPAAGTQSQVRVELVGPDGVRLGLPMTGGAARVADVPGARYAVHAEAFDVTLGTSSELRQEPVLLQAGMAETVVSGTLLAPPTLASAVTLSPGEMIRWFSVFGARTYSVTLAGLDDQGLVWEGFSPSTDLTLALEAPLATGNYNLTLAAWDEAAQAARSVAAVGPTRLRVLPLGGTYRRSSRLVRRSL